MTAEPNLAKPSLGELSERPAWLSDKCVRLYNFVFLTFWALIVSFIPHSPVWAGWAMSAYLAFVMWLKEPITPAGRAMLEGSES